jgi:acetyl-CoA carboxylase biotin carboxyl carrier protein
MSAWEGEVDVEAQITGNVWKIEKAVGDVVQEEDILLVIESMKMEIPVESPCAGKVREVLVTEGQSVEEGELLVVLEV